MFSDVINRTPLTQGYADTFFNRFDAELWQGDSSFGATLRALLQPRINEDETICLEVYSKNYSERQISNSPTDAAFRAICNDGPDHHISICNFCRADDASNRASMVLVKSEFGKHFPKSVYLERITNYFKSVKEEVLCFVEPDTKRVWIFVEHMTLKLWHMLQTTIPAFLPWYFKKEEALAEWEMELLASLRENTPDHYLECLERIAEQYNFYEQSVRTQLKGFERRFEEMELRRVNELIEHYMSEINYLKNQISEKLRYKREADIRAIGLSARIGSPQEGDSELMQYFLNNDHLILEKVSGNKMTFVTKCYLSYFDEDLAETAIRERGGYIYRPRGVDMSSTVSPDDMEMLMRAIFIDQTIRARFCGAFTFQLDELRVEAHQAYHYPPECNASYTPNTHFDRWSCLGTNKGEIEEGLANGNYLFAIEQCIAACSNLNFADITVMCEFVLRMYGQSDSNVNLKFLELPDGSVVEPKQAIQWLKEQREVTNNG